MFTLHEIQQHAIRIIQQYTPLLEQCHPQLSIENKPIGVAHKEHVGYLVFYKQKAKEIQYVIRQLDLLLAQARSRHYKRYTEGFSISLTERGKERYIEHEEDVVSINVLLNELQALLDQYNVVVEAFESRGYILNNLTKLLVEQAQDIVL